MEILLEQTVYVSIQDYIRGELLNISPVWNRGSFDKFDARIKSFPTGWEFTIDDLILDFPKKEEKRFKGVVGKRLKDFLLKREDVEIINNDSSSRQILYRKK